MSLARVELDYLVAPGRPWAAGAVVLGLSLALAASMLHEFKNLRLEIERIEAVRGLAVSQRVPRKALDEESKSAEAVMRQLALPWSAMVRAVESAASPDVAVLQLEPQARERQLRLTAEAKSEEAMLAYLRRLGGWSDLAEVRLASHQVMVEDPQRPIQFTALARLKDTP